MAVEVRITLRLPRELHADLSRVIEENKRSLNTEIVTRLEATFKGEPDPVQERLAKLEQQVAELQRALNLAEDEETESPSKVLLANARGKVD